MNILLFGHQGSGKTTYGKYLAQKLKLTYLSTGDILRSIESESTPLGEKVKSTIDKGFLIDDQLMWEILSTRIDGKKDGYVLDGFPRTLKQIEVLKKNNIAIDLVIYIHLDDDVSFERLLSRGRVDDTPDSIKNRWSLYRELTKPVIDELTQWGCKIIHINNSGTIEETQEQLDDRLKESFGN